MTTHTPGPWTFDRDWRRLPTIFGADGNKVAIVEKDKVDDRSFVHELPERFANARLIAAAPDMLDVLRAIVSDAANEKYSPESRLHSICEMASDAIRTKRGSRMSNDIPRRCRIDLMTPAELAIRNAVEEVEKVGADPRLTDSVVLLSAAQTRLADFIDGIPGRTTIPKQVESEGRPVPPHGSGP